MQVRLTPKGRERFPKSPIMIGISTDRAYALMKDGLAAEDKPFMIMYEANNPTPAEPEKVEAKPEKPAEPEKVEKKTKKSEKKK